MSQFEPCLDLCELITLSSTQEESMQQIEQLLAQPQLEGCKRIYLGSSFCGQAFLKSNDLFQAACRVAQNRGLSVTLTLPIFSQRWLDQGCAGFQYVLSQNLQVIDEVTVNDLGMLAYVNEVLNTTGLAIGINLGRLINKDTRDPRDPDYPNMVYTPNMLERSSEGENYLDRLVATWSTAAEDGQLATRICGIEFDPTHAALKLSDLPQGITAALHGPLCYMSTAQICEYASIGVAENRSFRPNMPCAAQCRFNAVGFWGSSQREFFKLGRTVYFEPPQPAVIGCSSCRLLHSPLKEVLS